MIRAQRVKAAFDDPKSAPDVIEYGAPDAVGHVKGGGLADATEDLTGWSVRRRSRLGSCVTPSQHGGLPGISPARGVRRGRLECLPAPADRDLADFERRMTAHHRRLDALGVAYRPPAGPRPRRRRAGVLGRPIEGAPPNV